MDALCIAYPCSWSFCYGWFEYKGMIDIKILVGVMAHVENNIWMHAFALGLGVMDGFGMVGIMEWNWMGDMAHENNIRVHALGLGVGCFTQC